MIFKRWIPVVISLFLILTVTACDQKSDTGDPGKNQKITVSEPTADSLDEYKKPEGEAPAKGSTADAAGNTKIETPKKTVTDKSSVTEANDAVYCANTNTMKFHYTDCKSVKKMNSDNMYKTNDREELISAGYTPCAICNP